jgi:SAM-dependent methyltransferase
MLKMEPTERFSSRVEHYVRARPAYPSDILGVLNQECGFSTTSVVADVGSGTGIFTRLLVENGNRVFAVEPNREMRRAAESYLAEYPNFVSLDGRAEATTLPDRSVDLITSAQAAHWFDQDKAVPEFQRILKPNGYLVLVWNERRIAASALGADYEELVRQYGIDYDQVKQRGSASAGKKFFGTNRFVERRLSNYQDLDYPALEQRLLSSSYVPPLGDERCAPMLAKLRQFFEKHHSRGRIRMEYDTKLYLGPANSLRSQPGSNKRGVDL